jgi:EmrB/QacA subfamily drug resistance transporter
LYLDTHYRTIPPVNAIASLKTESTRPALWQRPTFRWQRSGGSSKNALLLVVCLAQFMVILDVAIVNVALPSMRSGLHFSATGLQWVVNAYTLTFAGFLMLGGRSADLLGRRRVFLAGTAMFALSSLGCALADSRGLLIGARAIQGVSGAVLSPATLSIITASFAEGRERNRGLAAWGAVGGLGASSGALLGGVLTQSFGWPAIFAVNVPLGIVVVALGSRLIPVSARPEGTRHFDLTGAMLVTASLVSLTFGIVRTDTLGWGAPGVIVPLLGGVVLLAAFLLVEARFAREPLVPLSIFRIGHLRAANAVVLLLYASQFPGWFFLTLYLQQVLHYSAIEAGLGFLPMTLSIFAASTLAPRVVARFGPRRVIATGMLASAVGFMLLSGVSPGGAYVNTVLVGALFSALGMGFTLVPATIVAMQGVERSQSGVASGLLNTSRLVGGALGLAVLSTIAAGQTSAAVGAVPTPVALTNGFGLAYHVGTAFALAGAAIAAFRLRDPAGTKVVRLPTPATEEVQHEALAA